MQHPASPPATTQISPDGQALQTPPQPFDWPQALPVQSAAHTHWPYWQVPASHAGLQQVFTHVPLEQISPAGQLTPAQGLLTQLPDTHTWFAAQVAFWHGLGGEQVMLQAEPLGQGALHGSMAWQVPFTQ